ncbi:major facilitator superfamily domain-containing protein 12-like [Hyalella azteca]|uniref:Major facilitator superfamily domain-containing protein 12-like n=1 Tax=Hyalella azteca TaxID=294128 RepID=A0A8B7NKL8_HYAAZ|nr:major facilitator superfamily domain-containing protein 12-like [Hyalella azteca]
MPEINSTDKSKLGESMSTMEESECPDKPQNLNIGEPNLRSDFLRQRQDSVPSLTLTEKFCYGVGHVFNDLCASMWFSYLLLFFEKVLLFPDTLAGVVLLVGQLADGISTPIVGVLSDMENKIPACARYGRRKIWHLVGTVCVTISFPFIFSPAYGLEDASLTAQSIYYCCFVIVFQFGWASVQISHLALIPDLTPKKSLRTELNSIRYAFTVLANLSVFTITFFILGSGSTSDGDSSMSTPAMDSIWKTSSTSVPDSAISINGSCSASDTSLEPSDLNNFRTIALVCVVLGLIFSAIFHVGVKEPEFQCPKKREGSGSRMRKIDWFKQFPFYLVAVLYMATRLYVNLYQVYIPLFVQDTICLAKTAVATVPFTMYLAGFFGSLVMKKLNKVIGRKGTFATGCVIGLLGCTWTYAAGPEYADYFKVWGIFVVAVLLGSGGSTLLITSLSITADLIGNNTEGGAFVYGLMSLVDKFSNGIIIMIIQDSNTGDPMYYRDVIFYACGGACVVGLITTIALIPIKVHRRRGVAKSVISLMDGNADDSSDSGSDSSITLPSKKQLSGEVNEAADIVDTICGSLEKEAPIKHPRAIV